MSKKYKQKSCAYCFAGVSQTADHVFPRELLPVHLRTDIPKVPACGSCNTKKAALEHYITAILPFGGWHPSARKILEDRVSKRLDRNAPLHRSLQVGVTDTWIVDRGALKRTIAVPFDFQKFKAWLELVVSGPSLYHFNFVLPINVSIDVFATTVYGDSFLGSFLKTKTNQIVNYSISDGMIRYAGSHSEDNQWVQLWCFSFYGGLITTEDDPEGWYTNGNFWVFVLPKRPHQVR